MARPGGKARARRKKKVRNPPAQLAPPGEREPLRPVSLHPLSFEEAIKRLIAVKPRTISRSTGSGSRK